MSQIKYNINFSRKPSKENNEGNKYRKINGKKRDLKSHNNQNENIKGLKESNKSQKIFLQAFKFILIFFLLINFPQIKGANPDWMKLIELKHKNINYPSITRINKHKDSNDKYFVLAYQKRVTSRFRVFSSYQIFLTFFKKDLSIFQGINSKKIESRQIPIDKDQIEPKVVSFKFSPEGSQPNNFVVIWKSKSSCPSMKFQAAKFTYGNIQPNYIKYLTECGPKYGEIQSALNYDVITTHTDKLFLIWHQKNGENDKDYDIYFKIFNKELKEIKAMTNIYTAKDSQTNLGPQMYPNLIFSKGHIVAVYQDGNAKNNHDLSYKYKNTNILLRAYDDNGNLKFGTYNITPDYDSAIFPKIHYMNDSDYFDNEKNGKFFISFLKNDDERGTYAKFQLKQKKFELKIEGVELKLSDTEAIDYKIIEDIINFEMKNLPRNCGPDLNKSPCPVKSTQQANDPNYKNTYAIDQKNEECNKYFFHSVGDNNMRKWWKVEFSEKTKIKKIRLQTRKHECVDRLNGFGAIIGIVENGINKHFNKCYQDEIKVFNRDYDYIEIYCEGETNFIEIDISNLDVALQICELQAYEHEEQTVFPKFNSKNGEKFLITYRESSDEIVEGGMKLTNYDISNNQEEATSDLSNMEQIYSSNKLPLIYQEKQDEFGTLEYYIDRNQMSFKCDESCKDGCYNGPFKCNSCSQGYLKSDDGKCLNDKTSEGYKKKADNSGYEKCEYLDIHPQCKKNLNPDFSVTPPDWMKFFDIKDFNISYPSIKRVKEFKDSTEKNYVIVYQKKENSVNQIYLQIFEKDLTIINKEEKISMQDSEKDNIEPKIVSFNNAEKPLRNNYVVIWKTKSSCPSMKFQAARFTYGDNKPNRMKYLTECGPKYGDIQSALNYDVIATSKDRLFFIWHQKNDNDYDIYFKIFNKELVEIQEMTNIISPDPSNPNISFRNQMYPNLLKYKDRIVVFYQDDNPNNTNAKGSSIFMMVFEDSLNKPGTNKVNLSTDYEYAIFPRIHYRENTNHFTSDQDGKYFISFLVNNNDRGSKAEFDLKGIPLDIPNSQYGFSPNPGSIFTIKEKISVFEMKNLARNCGKKFNSSPCQVNSSSVYSGTDNNMKYSPSLAIDGYFNKCTDGFFFHSKVGTGEHWLKVKISEDINTSVKKIKIHTRSDRAERFKKFYAKIGYNDMNGPFVTERKCYMDKNEFFNNNNYKFIEIYCEGQGNVIEIGVNHPSDSDNALQICEYKFLRKTSN